MKARRTIALIEEAVSEAFNLHSTVDESGKFEVGGGGGFKFHDEKEPGRLERGEDALDGGGDADRPAKVKGVTFDGDVGRDHVMGLGVPEVGDGTEESFEVDLVGGELVLFVDLGGDDGAGDGSRDSDHFSDVNAEGTDVGLKIGVGNKANAGDFVKRVVSIGDGAFSHRKVDGGTEGVDVAGGDGGFALEYRSNCISHIE